MATKQNYSAKPDDVAHFGSLPAKYIFMAGSLTYTMHLMPGTGTGTHTQRTAWMVSCTGILQAFLLDNRAVFHC